MKRRKPLQNMMTNFNGNQIQGAFPIPIKILKKKTTQGNVLKFERFSSPFNPEE